MRLTTLFHLCYNESPNPFALREKSHEVHMGYILLLPVLALLPLPFVRLLNTSFARALPAALASALMAALAAAALLHSLPVALALTGAAFAVAAALSLLLCPDRRALLRRYIQPDFAAFCVVFTAIYLFYGARYFIWWDEWSHWGLMVKAMCLSDKLYTDPAVWMPVHKDYPISLTLFGYAWSKLSGGYSEANALRSLYTFCAAMALAFFDTKNLKFRGLWKPLLAVAVSFICVTAADNAGFPFTYYMDAPAGLVFGLLIWQALRMDFTKTREYVPCFILLIFLALIKEIGVLLALVAAAIFLFCFAAQALAAKRAGAPFAIWPRVPLLIATFALPLLTFALWRDYVKGLGIGGQFQLEPAPLRDVLAAFIGRGSEFQARTFARFWKGFFFVAQRYVMPLWALLAVLILAGVFYAKRAKGMDGAFLARFRAAAPVWMLGYLAFGLALLYLYMFGGFSKAEANRLASMDRYLGCYATAMVVVCAGIYYEYRLGREKTEAALDICLNPPSPSEPPPLEKGADSLDHGRESPLFQREGHEYAGGFEKNTSIQPSKRVKSKAKKSAAERTLIAFLVATMALRPSPALVAPLAGRMASADFARAAVAEYRSLLDPETDRVYLVQDKDSQRLFQFAYYLYPVRSSPAGQGKLDPGKLSAAALRKRWTQGGYTHLIIADYSEILRKDYPELFACEAYEIGDGVLFRIDHTKGAAVLIPLHSEEFDL